MLASSERSDPDGLTVAPGGRGWRASYHLRRGAPRALALSLLTLCLPLAGSLLAGAPALALSQRGHVFCEQCSFGSAGAGDGELSSPGAIAVNEETGDVYVVNRANNRIERFDSEGAFIAAWGWGVKDGAKEYEICESDCRAGLAGAGKGELDSAGMIAIDNSPGPSSGDVYLIADARAERGRLEKFTAQGEPLTDVKQQGHEAKWEGALDGVAVDQTGRLWVYRSEEATATIEHFTGAVKNKFVEEEPGLESPVPCPQEGFAVSASGVDLYVGHERENAAEGCPAQEGEPPRPLLAAELRFEVHEGEASLTTLSAGIDPQSTTGVAVDESSGQASSGDVYLDNASSVAAFTAQGALIQRFGTGDLGQGAGIALDASTGDVYVADAEKDRIDVFTPEGAGPPAIDAVSVAEVTSQSARLIARIDPDGAATRYTFQYGSECPSSCLEVPGGEDIPAGFADQEVVVELHGLKAATTYQYRVLAENAHGPAQGSESFATITTPPEPQGLLPDGRAWEMVSPPHKDGSSILPLTATGGVIQASANGNAITYLADGPIVKEPQGSVAPEVTQVLSTRSSEGWASQELVTPQNRAEGNAAYSLPEYQFFSQDLSLALVQPPVANGEEPLAQPPLSPPVLTGETQERTLYLRDDQPLAPEAAQPEEQQSEQEIYNQAKQNSSYLAPGYLPLVDGANDEAKSAFGDKLKFLSATPDLSRVLFESEVALTPGSGPEGNLYEWQSGRPLQLVSVLPGGTAASEPQLGQDSANVRDAISENGTRVIFSSESESESGALLHHLYLRDTQPGHEQTLELNAAGPGIDPAEAQEGEVGFQTASSDGSKVLFTDTARLTEESNQIPLPGAEFNPADLYECEILENAEGSLECHLKDLSPAAKPGEGADVLNVLPGASEDGSDVYFVANAKLTPEATQGQCIRNAAETPSPAARCNLYLAHEGKLTFIAALSDEDSPDWGALDSPRIKSLPVEERPDLADVTSRVSPDGRYLAFMSDQELTGYDNVDASPEAHGAHDEEVFLYDAQTKHLTCVSCNPDGQPPHGVHDIPDSGEGVGLLVDRRGDWLEKEDNLDASHWLAGSIPGSVAQEQTNLADHQPSYLLDDGRLYFNSPDDLVPPATNGKEDVYRVRARRGR